MRHYCHYSHTCLKCSGKHPAAKCHEKYQNNRTVMSQPSSDNPVPHFFRGPIPQIIKTPGTTPIYLCNMYLYLSYYPYYYPKTLDASELRDNFKYGFKINYSCPRFVSTCDNLISTKHHPEEAKQKLY